MSRAKHKKLTNEDAKILELMKTAIVRCDLQFERFSEEGDHEMALDWIARKSTCERLYESIKNILGVKE